MIDLLRSSVARRSFSLAGMVAEAEIRTRANIDAKAASTACRRAIEGFGGGASGLLVDVLEDRFLRRKAPVEMKEAAAAVGVGGCVCSTFVGSDFPVDPGSPCLDACCDVVDDTGATSLAMRASMKVTKVNETLWAGE